MLRSPLTSIKENKELLTCELFRFSHVHLFSEAVGDNYLIYLYDFLIQGHLQEMV